jgi:hypothetical protein
MKNRKITMPRINFVAVGTPVTQAPPRTDPYVQNYCIRLLPQILGVEAHVGMWVQDFRTRNPTIDQRQNRSQVTRCRWLRRRSARYQRQITWARKLFRLSILPGTAW